MAPVPCHRTPTRNTVRRLRSKRIRRRLQEQVREGVLEFAPVLYPVPETLPVSCD